MEAGTNRDSYYNRDAPVRRFPPLWTILAVCAVTVAAGKGGHEIAQSEQREFQADSIEQAQRTQNCTKVVQHYTETNSKRITLRLGALTKQEQTDCQVDNISDGGGVVLLPNGTEVPAATFPVTLDSVDELQTTAAHAMQSSHEYTTGDKVFDVAMSGLVGALGLILSGSCIAQLRDKD